MAIDESSATWSGWIREMDLARRAELEATAMDDAVVRRFCGENENLPDVIDPREWCRKETQARSDCAGFAHTAAAESTYVLATGRLIQFSQHFAYREAQRLDGIRGDNGSTISGHLRVGREIGCCPYDACPYPGSYNSPITDAMRQAASPYKIGGHIYARSYDQVKQWIQTAQGGLHWGLGWRWQPLGGSGANSFVLERFLGRGPGHATALLGLSERKDRSGRPYIWLWNSGYPVPGWYEVSPDAIEGACQTQDTVTIGYSKLSTPAPKRFEYSALGD